MLKASSTYNLLPRKISGEPQNRHPSNNDSTDIQDIMRHHETFLIPAVFGAATDERHVDRRPNGRARGDVILSNAKDLPAAPSRRRAFIPAAVPSN